MNPNPSSYDYRTVKVQIEGGIAWATLNRPDKRNAMSPELHDEMDDALAKLEFDTHAQIVVISGAGGNFSAGQDLKKFFRELEDDPAERNRAKLVSNRWRWERLQGYAKPTIAMVEGYCVGGAFMQLCGCDFALAAEDATFSLSEINWGIIPASLVAKVVADAILPRHALYYACVGEGFDGVEAARIGLVNRAVPSAQLRAATVELAGKLMAKSPSVLRATRHAMRHVRGMHDAQAYDYLSDKLKVSRIGDGQDSYHAGLSQFLDEKSYKPAHMPFRLTKP